MKTEITVMRTAYRVVLKLRWEGDDWRSARADCFRLAALIEEKSSSERWVTVVGDGIEHAGKGLLGGHVGVELATGGGDEAVRAEALLREIATKWQAR